MKKRLSTIMMLAVLIVGSTTTAWAGELFSGTVTGGQLSFYSDAACANKISEAESGSTVYFRAIPDYGYTGIGATFSASASVGSDQAESRRATSSNIPFGETIDVTTVDNTRGIYSLEMPDNTNVTVSGTLETVTATSVSYVDENYETQTVSAVPLDLTMTTLANDKWYFVGNDITFDEGFTFIEGIMTSNMCIVVADGATFTIGTKDKPLQSDAFSTSGSLFLYGQDKATGKLSINSAEGGVSIGGSFVIANLDVDVTSESTALSGASNGNGSFIAGHPTKGNTVTVRSNSTGISTAGKPLVIKCCDVDVVANGTGLNAGGTNLTIEGMEDGGNNVTLRCAGYGIFAGGGSVTIKYCNIEVTGATQNEAGEYGYCSNSGICESKGSGINIIGSAKGNNVTIRSNGNGGILGEWCAVAISNFDLDITCTNGYGIYATSNNGLSLVSTLEEGNKAKVVSKKSAMLNYNSSLTIDNYTVEINSEESGIFDTSKLNINNSDITIESVGQGVYAVGSGNTITNSCFKVTTTGEYNAVFAPNSFTMNGGQLDVTAQEGYYGIDLASATTTATFGWTKATDYFKVSSYRGTVKVANGQTLKDEENNIYSGTLPADAMAVIGGKKLMPGSAIATFAPKGYATYYASSYDLVLPEGMKAFVVTDKGADKGALTYEAIADGDTEQNIVPAGTAVMLKVAATDGEQTIPITIGSGADAYSGNNLLSGSDTLTTIPKATGELYYKLTYGNDDTTFGWYWGGENGLSFTSDAHKAWLTLPASVDARFLGLPDYEATGIAQQKQTRQSAWYTIGGMKLNGQPTAKGMYIKDGKKVIK